MRGTKAGLPAGGRDDIPKCYLCGAGKSICFALLRELWYHDVQGRGSCGGVVCLYLALPGRFLVHGMYQRHCASAGGPPEWKRRQVHPEPAAGVLSLSGGGGRQIRGAMSLVHPMYKEPSPSCGGVLPTIAAGLCAVGCFSFIQRMYWRSQVLQRKAVVIL